MLDVRSYHYGMQEIINNMPNLQLYKGETIEGQRRLEKLWSEMKSSLHNRLAMPKEKLFDWQLNRIKDIVDNAYMTHRFYYNLYRSAGYRLGDIRSWNDYEALPSITKDDILLNYSDFETSRSIPTSDCHSARTSGSSGRALSCFEDDNTCDQITMFHLRFYEQMLGRQRNPDEWMYEIYLVPPAYTSLDGKYPHFTLINHCNPVQAVAHIRKLRPAILSSFPSYLLRMVRSGADLRGLGVNAITTNSETSTAKEREIISEAFGCPVFDEYGSVELSLIAVQCKFQNYHLVEDNVRIDISNEDSAGVGGLVGTNLVNNYMPFIRYKHNDLINIDTSPSACPCGCSFRTLKSFQGRSDQNLISRTTGLIPSDRLMTLYDHILLKEDINIGEFKIVQDSMTLVKIYLETLPGKTIQTDLVKQFESGLKKLFADPGLTVEIVMCDRVPQNSSYKRRIVINKISDNSLICR